MSKADEKLDEFFVMKIFLLIRWVPNPGVTNQIGVEALGNVVEG